jgi:hypothetical protein
VSLEEGVGVQAVASKDALLLGDVCRTRRSVPVSSKEEIQRTLRGVGTGRKEEEDDEGEKNAGAAFDQKEYAVVVEGWVADSGNTVGDQAGGRTGRKVREVQQNRQF